MKSVLNKGTVGAIIFMIIVFTSVALSNSSKLKSDAKFLNKVHETNHTLIEKTSDEDLVDLGHAVCESLDVGYDSKELVFDISGAKDYSQETLVIYGAIIVKSAVQTICPKHMDQIESWVL